MAKTGDRLINNILGYSQQCGDLLNKYNIDFYLNHFDRNAITNLSLHIEPQSFLTVHEFVRVFLLHIDHSQNETLFLALSLKQLFECILERTSNKTSIQFSDFTTYLCEKIAKQGLDIVVPCKKISRSPCMSTTKLRQIDLHPAQIINKVEVQMTKIDTDQPKINRKVDQIKGVSQFYYSQQKRQVIALGVLSPSVMIYNQELKLQREIRPKQGKQMQKDIAILSMAYNQSNDRIGAILTNSTMVFWQGGDNYTTQKIISNRSIGDKILYFQNFKVCLTIDKNQVNFWNLEQEIVQNSIFCSEATSITDVCQIHHLKSICVATVNCNQDKWLTIYHDFKIKAKISLGGAGCHTLHYNPTTHCLIPIGYQTAIPVYTIQGSQFDVQLKHTLHGHKSIITCVDSLDSQSLMITGDDTGQVRVWDLNYMRCVQSVKIARWLGHIKLKRNLLFFSDQRINIMKMSKIINRQKQSQNQKDSCQTIYQYIDQNQSILWVFTNKDARKIDLKVGKVMKIYVLCSQNQDIAAACKTGGGFVVGNSKGQIKHYDSDCNLRWTKQAHQAEIRQLVYDKKHRFIFSVSSDGKTAAWPQRTIQYQSQRKLIVFKSKQITNLSISQDSTLAALFNCQQTDLSLWNYDLLKLYQVLQMQSPINALLFAQQLNFIVIATNDGKVYFIRFDKTEHQLHLQLLAQCHLDAHIQVQKQSVVSLLTLIQSATRNFVLATTNRGSLIRININPLVNKNFNKIMTLSKKQSSNINRTQQEEFENSFEQSGSKRKISQLKQQAGSSVLQLEVQWLKKYGHQTLKNIIFCPYDKNIVGVTCSLRAKMIQISSTQVMGQLDIDEPLPFKWNLKLQINLLLKKQICETLKIIDHILKNNGYQMLAKQYKLINLTNFMQMVSKQQFLYNKPKIQAQLLSRDQQNSLNLALPQPTLKNLQAYKRVQLIKKQSQQSMQMPVLKPLLNEQSLKTKNDITNILNPKKQLKPQQPVFESELVKRLQKNLSCNLLPRLRLTQKQNEKTKHLQTARSRKVLHKRNSLSKSFALDELKQQRWKQRSQDKNVKEILAELNTKLKMHRSNKNSRHMQ